MFKTTLAAAAVLSATLAAPAFAHTPGEVHHQLRHRGYYNINFIVAHPPQYQVNACRDGGRFHLHINFYGDVTERSYIGRCHRYDADYGRRYEGYRRYY